jgi:hypothetical protein
MENKMLLNILIPKRQDWKRENKENNYVSEEDSNFKIYKNKTTL